MADTTVIEEILESITTVPYAVKRHFELMRELDSRVTTLLNELADDETAVVTLAAKENGTSIAAGLGDHGKAALKAIAKKRRLCDDLTDEKISIAEQTLQILHRHVDVVGSELSALSAHLHATGEFESSGSARPGDEVAIRLDDGECWILARVVKFRAEASIYDVADADDERKIYQLPEAKVVPLSDSSGRSSVAAPHALAPVASVLSSVVDKSIPGMESSGPNLVKLAKGDEVFAIYPDTTSFYPAVVSIPPRRAIASNAICHVQFNDDADDSGLNPDRPVALKYILRPVV